MEIILKYLDKMAQNNDFSHLQARLKKMKASEIHDFCRINFIQHRSLLHYLCIFDLVNDKSMLDGYDVNQEDEIDQTPMHLCCRFDSVISAKTLLSCPALDIYKVDKLGRNYLHYACRNNHIELAKLLLAAGIDINNVDNFGDLPLHYAAAHYDNELFGFLASQDISSLELKNWQDKSPIDYIYDAQDAAKAEILYKYGYDKPL